MPGDEQPASVVGSVIRMNARRFGAWLVALVLTLGGSSAVAQRPPVHYTRAQERVRCLEQCDRYHGMCVDGLHRPVRECAGLDTRCRLACNERFPRPGGGGVPEGDVSGGAQP